MGANSTQLARVEGGVEQLLSSMSKQVELALPQFIKPERFMRVMLTQIRATPKLLDCSKESFLGAMMDCAQLGLEPGSALGHAYLVPYKNTCTLVTGYKGVVERTFGPPTA